MKLLISIYATPLHKFFILKKLFNITKFNFYVSLMFSLIMIILVKMKVFFCSTCKGFIHFQIHLAEQLSIN